MGAQKSNNPRVLIIGSGFGGLFAARALRKAKVDIQLLSTTSHHLFQPLLYQVATGILSEGTIAPSTREILANQKNVETIRARVHTIDVAHRKVYARSFDVEQCYEYDYLIVAAGAGQSYFGNDHFSQYAPGMKTIDDALELRSRIFNAFELAELAAVQGRTEDVRRHLTFVVAGAGPTGVEMAGQVAELANRTLTKEYRNINPRDTRVILADGSDRVLKPFGDFLSEKAHQGLVSLGVEVHLETLVTDVDENGVRLRAADGDEMWIEAATKIWAAGVAASPLATQLAEQVGAEVDRAGRLKVDQDLTLPGHKNVFVIGDMVNLNNNPGVAPHAIQGAKFCTKNIISDLAGKVRETHFEYVDKGSMAIVSRFSAVAKVKAIKLHGMFAWFAWLALHLLTIVGFKNQISTLFSWAVTFVTDARTERTNTVQQAVARTMLANWSTAEKDAYYRSLTGTLHHADDQSDQVGAPEPNSEPAPSK